MSEERITRRLAAILAADVVGYSRLMGRDEAGTLARLKAHRTVRLEPAISRNHGRLVKLTGDGALVEFGSAVDALSAAIEFQQAVADANRNLPEDMNIVFRIGLHLGDLIVEGEDLYGDGVNVAARLEAEAPPGRIIVSSNLYDAVVGRLKTSFEDLGELALKNIDRPVRAYRVGEALASTKSTRTPSPHTGDTALALPDKPSIAVLPFQNMSGDPEQEYFVDGLVEDIITALSRFRSLFVIARNSSFVYKGRAIDIRQVGRELGVRYVLEGSLRKAGGRLRITGQLVDGATGAHIWADRYDGSANDVFDLQDQVMRDVVGAITPKLEQADIERVTRKPTEHIGAYDCYLRGVAAYHTATAEGLRKAQKLFGQAIALDPGFAAPYALSSFSEALLHGMGAGQFTATQSTSAVTLSRRAVEIDRDDGLVLATATWVEAHFARNMDAAGELAERAITVNPNLAFAWAAAGWVSVWKGKPLVAIEHFEQARRLSPLDVNQRFVWTGMAQAHLLARKYDDAMAYAVKALQVWRQAPAYRVAAASAALGGNIEEARKFVQGLLEVDPERRLSNIEQSIGAYQRREDVELLLSGLRLGGLPE